MALGHFRHPERRDDAGDMLLHNGLSDFSPHLSRQGNVSMLKTEYHHRQALVLASAGKPQTPPDIDRVKHHERDIVFVEFLGQDRTSIAFASAALGEDGKSFGRGVEREVNGNQDSDTWK